MSLMSTWSLTPVMKKNEQRSMGHSPLQSRPNPHSPTKKKQATRPLRFDPQALFLQVGKDMILGDPTHQLRSLFSSTFWVEKNRLNKKVVCFFGWKKTWCSWYVHSPDFDQNMLKCLKSLPVSHTPGWCQRSLGWNFNLRFGVKTVHLPPMWLDWHNSQT